MIKAIKALKIWSFAGIRIESGLNFRAVVFRFLVLFRVWRFRV